MSTLAVGTIKSVSSNVPPVFQDSGGTGVGQLCRASIRFSQQNTQSIQSSFNVSSIADEGTGLTQINFTNNIRNDAGTESSNYAVVNGQDGTAVSTSHLMMFVHSTPAADHVEVIFYNIDNSNLRADAAMAMTAIFC